MIAEWMLYSALCALGLLAASAVAERWLSSAGAPVRHVWSVALFFSLAIPAATYRFAPRQTITIPAAASPVATDVDAAAELPHAMPLETSGIRVANVDHSFRKLIPANGVAIKVWIGLSGALLTYLVVGLIALARLRRTWRRVDVCGVSVLVSDDTGPALVNVFSPQIVMPEWALSMDRYQLGLMVRHEQEHRRARYLQLLAAAQLALVAMPWNPALWWGVLRLGMAVELDCDARVLQTADPRTYGDLLLEVARPRRRPRLVAVAAFAERADGLERRIRAIARPRNSITRGARAGAAVIALAVAGAAWVAPHPSLPPRLTFAPPVPTGPDAGASAQRSLENANAGSASPTRSAKLEAPPIERVFRGDTAILPTMRARGDEIIVKTPRPAFSSLDSLIFDRLFGGIVMSPDQEIAARLLLANLAQIQTDMDRRNVADVTRSSVERVRLNHERDSLLFALAPTDADRDLIASRLATSLGGGRRGRSGNPPGLSEVPVNAPAGGMRSGARGRVGGNGQSLQEAPANDAVERVLFGLLFDGISLSPDQEAEAVSIIGRYRKKLVETFPEPPLPQLRLSGPSSVLMRPETRAAVLALLSSDADRVTVDSRIVTEVRVVDRQPPAPPR